MAVDPHVWEAVERAQKRRQERVKTPQPDFDLHLGGVRFAVCQDGPEMRTTVHIADGMKDPATGR